MLRRVGYLLSIAALSAVAITNPAAARRQPSGGQPQPSGSARVTGRVVAADTGTPVRLAEVSLSGLPDSQRMEGPNHPYVYVSRQVLTDVNGRFDVAALPAGSYNLTVNPVSGFVRPRAHGGDTRRRANDGCDASAGAIGCHRGPHSRRERRRDARRGGPRSASGDVWQLHNPRCIRSFGNDKRPGRIPSLQLACRRYYVLATYSRPRHAGDPVPQSGYANTYILVRRRFAAREQLSCAPAGTARA